MSSVSRPSWHYHNLKNRGERIVGIGLLLVSILKSVFAERPCALYVGCVGNRNLGDEAVYAAVRDLFINELVFLGWSPNKVPPLRLVSRIRNVKAIFLGGGTLIKKGRALYLGQVQKLARLFPDAKLIVFGTGVADATMWERFGVVTDKEGWCAVLEHASFLGVRGPLSKQFLEEWGVRSEIRVLGDPALWFARQEMRPKARAMRVGLNLGPSRGYIHGQDENRLLRFGIDLVRNLVREGWQVTLIPMCDDDLDFLLRIASEAGGTAVNVHSAYLDLNATLATLEKQDVFIGEKLHSVVLSHCVYTPSIMIEYRTKCRDYMQSVDRERYIFRTDELDLERVLGCLHELYNSIEQHQVHLFSEVQGYKAALHAAARTVLELVGR